MKISFYGVVSLIQFTDHDIQSINLEIDPLTIKAEKVLGVDDLGENKKVRFGVEESRFTVVCDHFSVW